MKKILVTTDFSKSSKAAIRFVIQLEQQMKAIPTFFHAIRIDRPHSLPESEYHAYESQKIAITEKKLKQFVAATYRSSGISNAELKCVVKNTFVAESSIMDYASQMSFDFICISRRGESKAVKLFGSNTTNLILRSKVPLMTIPPTYRRTSIKRLSYATDMAHLKNELKIIREISEPLDASVEILHINYPGDLVDVSQIVKNAIGGFPNMKISTRYKKADLSKNLARNILTVVKNNAPSALIMFTRQNNSFLDVLLFSGNSAEYAKTSSIPLMIYPRKTSA